MAERWEQQESKPFHSEWKSDLDSKVTLPDGRRLPVVLVANKVCAGPGCTDRVQCDLLSPDEMELIEERCDQAAREQG